MGYISNLFTKVRPSREEILNDGFAMTMEFGKNWLQPINDRLKDKFGFLAEQEIELYSGICRDARNDSSDFVLNTLGKVFDSGETIKDSDFRIEFENHILQKFDWVNKSNLNRAYSQGMYYSWREGLTSVVK
jgi:hypothetical protein